MLRGGKTWRQGGGPIQFGNQSQSTTSGDSIFAVLDLGTNNCRLLIAKPLGEGFRVIDKYSRIVRLGEGLARSGELSESAMQRTLAALSVCARKLRCHNITHTRFIATEACRRAHNRSEFLRRVEVTTGICLEIVSPEEEARLAVAACGSLLDSSCECGLIFDIGGGSTELIWLRVSGGSAPEKIDSTSLACGVVTLAERYNGREPSRETYAAMVDEVEQPVRQFATAHGIRSAFAGGSALMVGMSGTVTTIAALSLGLKRYDRRKVDGRWLTREEVDFVSRKVFEMTYSDRVAHPCIRRERADLIIPGCAALEAMTRSWPATGIRVADRGLRDGMMVDLSRAIGAAPSVVGGQPAA